MKPSSFERIIRAMVPTTSRIDAEALLLGAQRAHRACPQDRCLCGLLEAAGSFYVAMAYHAHGHALEKLLESWIDIAKAYDRGDDLEEHVRELYRTAFTYRLLLT